MNTELEQGFKAHFRALKHNLHMANKTIEEYERLGVRPPDSFMRYYAGQLFDALEMVDEAKRAAMPDGAWAESDGAR